MKRGHRTQMTVFELQPRQIRAQHDACAHHHAKATRNAHVRAFQTLRDHRIEILFRSSRSNKILSAGVVRLIGGPVRPNEPNRVIGHIVKMRNVAVIEKWDASSITLSRETQIRNKVQTRLANGLGQHARFEISCFPPFAPEGIEFLRSRIKPAKSRLLTLMHNRRKLKEISSDHNLTSTTLFASTLNHRPKAIEQVNATRRNLIKNNDICHLEHGAVEEAIIAEPWGCLRRDSQGSAHRRTARKIQRGSTGRSQRNNLQSSATTRLDIKLQDIVLSSSRFTRQENVFPLEKGQ